MNKQGVIEALAKEVEITRARAARIVDAIFSPSGILAAQLKKGEKVQIAGFGSFEARERPARQGRNPTTGNAIAINASTVPTFRAGKGLRDQVNKRK